LAVTPRLRKYVVLVVLVGGVVFLDWWTKRWAHATLASEEHPLPFTVTGVEAGRPLAEVVALRFPDLAQDAPAVTKDLVRLVEREPRPAASQNPFAPLPRAGRRQVPLAYLVFAEGFEAAPRVIPLVEKPLLRRWLGFVWSERPPAELDARVDAEFEGLTLDEYLAEHIAVVDAAEAAAAIDEGRVLPLFTHRVGVDPQRPAAPGELYLLTERRVEVIPGFFRFDYKENPGAAWGLLATHGAPFRRVVLTGVSSLAAVVILIIFVRLQTNHWSAILAFSSILAGAIGNLIDRLQFNYVIDFFDMYISYMHWPTYNVADVAITLGVVSLVFEMLFVKSSPFAARAMGAVPVPAPVPAPEPGGPLPGAAEAAGSDPDGGAATHADGKAEP
jgi:signal peptidase II